MAVPNWVNTISNHAVISRDELLQWLDISANELRTLIDERGFPAPRYVGALADQRGPWKLTHKCKWRVGDVRAWKAGSSQALEKEVATPIGAARGAWTDKSEAAMRESGVHLVGRRSARVAALAR